VHALVGGDAVVRDWGPTKAGRSGIAAPSRGRGYTLVVMGPSRVVDDATPWNPPGITIVDNDP
jgi:hypothetical protein